MRTTQPRWCARRLRQCRRERTCTCGSALAHAILTDRSKIPAATREKLELILDKYLSTEATVKESTWQFGCSSVRSIPLRPPRAKLRTCLGGAATYFALAASYFTDVRVVAIVGEDFTAEHEAVLKKRGVDTAESNMPKGKSFTGRDRTWRI